MTFGYRFWSGLDTLAHKLRLPRPLRYPICNAFDRFLERDRPGEYVRRRQE